MDLILDVLVVGFHVRESTVHGFTLVAAVELHSIAISGSGKLTLIPDLVPIGHTILIPISLRPGLHWLMLMLMLMRSTDLVRQMFLQ